MPFAIHDRALRQRLEVRSKPYFARLCDGVCIGYRKGKSVSRWVVRRRRSDGSYQLCSLVGVIPDDHLAADGSRVLDFQQAVGKVMTDNQKLLLCCSFCGKDRHAVAKLIAGPSVFICDACVGLCQLYLDNPNGGKLVLDDQLRPVLANGKPQFQPLTDEERRRFGMLDEAP